MALGLANEILRRLLDAGLVERDHSPNAASRKISYVITDRGRAEHHRMSRAHLGELVHSYAQARSRIMDALNQLLTHTAEQQTDRIVFYGPREVAEIGCLCVQGTGLQLVGIVDDTATDGMPPEAVMGMSVCRPEDLFGRELNGRAFDCLVVLSFDDPHVTHQRLADKGVPPERVWWA